VVAPADGGFRERHGVRGIRSLDRDIDHRLAGERPGGKDPGTTPVMIGAGALDDTCEKGPSAVTAIWILYSAIADPYKDRPGLTFVGALDRAIGGSGTRWVGSVGLTTGWSAAG
jgi:hypothetical protein